jgi:hypothetical protein
MIPRILHQAWTSNDRLKEKYYKWRLSWIEKNPDYSFMFWDLDSIPFDKLTPNGAKLMRMPLKFTVKSDIIRWELLFLFGGIWADMDTECRKPFDCFLNDESFAGVSYHPDGIGNAIVGTIAGTDLIKQIRDATNEAILSDIPRSFDIKRLNEAHGATFVGSNYLYKVKKIYPRSYFYPYHPTESWQYRNGSRSESFPESYVIHKWEGAAPGGWGHVDY